MDVHSRMLGRISVLGTHILKCHARSSSSSAHVPKLYLQKSEALIDERVQIVVEGLSQGEKVTLQTCFEDSKKLYGACGHYIASYEGKVDTFTDRSHGGTFVDVEPMGLFWSSKSVPGQSVKRIVKQDVTTPFHVQVGLQRGFHEFESLVWSPNFSCVTSTILKRYYMAAGVQRIPFHENGVHGVLFLPPGQGPFPGLIDIFGLAGGILEFRAALLASRGFATLSLPYTLYKDLPVQENDIDYHYFLKAFDWLAAHPSINPKALGSVASCVGGGYMNMVASMRPALKCLVSINNPGHPHGRQQVVEGEFVSTTFFDWNKLSTKGEILSMWDVVQTNEDTKYLPAWKHGLKALYICGLDDQCIQPLCLDNYEKQVPEQFRTNYTFVKYPGTGHLLEPPYMPLCSKTSFFQGFGFDDHKIVWGGNPKAHADAQEDAWMKLFGFLHKHLIEKTV